MIRPLRRNGRRQSTGPSNGKGVLVVMDEILDRPGSSQVQGSILALVGNVKVRSCFQQHFHQLRAAEEASKPHRCCTPLLANNSARVSENLGVQTSVSPSIGMVHRPVVSVRKGKPVPKPRCPLTKRLRLPEKNQLEGVCGLETFQYLRKQDKSHMARKERTATYTHDTK